MVERKTIFLKILFLQLLRARGGTADTELLGSVGNNM